MANDKPKVTEMSSTTQPSAPPIKPGTLTPGMEKKPTGPLMPGMSKPGVGGYKPND
jgi:hypothetical protein